VKTNRSRSHENKSSGVGDTVMKTHSSGAKAGATFMNRRAPEPVGAVSFLPQLRSPVLVKTYS